MKISGLSIHSRFFAQAFAHGAKVFHVIPNVLVCPAVENWFMKTVFW